MNIRLLLLLVSIGILSASRGQVYEKVFSFTDTVNFEVLNSPYAHSTPISGLIQGLDGNFYGITLGNGDDGTIFRMTPAGTLTILFEFNGTNGSAPTGLLVQDSEGNFYGTTKAGGINDRGTVFRMTPATVLTTIHDFGFSDGQTPNGLIQGSDGSFYGTTKRGGANDLGTIFRINAQQDFTTLVEFTGNGAANKGGRPEGGLVEGSDGNFYGTTLVGGALNLGTIFRMTPAGELTTLVEFTSNGASNKGRNPFAALVQGSDGNFYGTTDGGGTLDRGTVFRMASSGELTTLAEFTHDGAVNRGQSPRDPLIEGADGNFYGTTTFGGELDDGTVFRITPSGELTTLVEFGSNPGSLPLGSLWQASDGNFYGVTTSTVFRLTPDGQLTTLVEFLGGNASLSADLPSGSLLAASDGNLYGTTIYGGRNDAGTIYRVSPAGSVSILLQFSGDGEPSVGRAPYAGLIEADDGNFYGTTAEGGPSNLGTIFRVTPAGALTTLVVFNYDDPNVKGGVPLAELLQASDGNFYGTTSIQGAGASGTVFRLTPAGEFTTLVEFTGIGGGHKGKAPQGALVEGADGLLYGSTMRGGAADKGTLFKMTREGALTTLVEFTGNGSENKGSGPAAALTPGNDGNFYGTTLGGGSADEGTVFKVTPDGVLTTLVEFTGNGAVNRGSYPFTPLTPSEDGNFYGTTQYAGANGAGTVFKMTPAGELTTLHDFPQSGDSEPLGRLILARDGNFYGTTSRINGLPTTAGAGAIYRMIVPGSPSLLVFPPEAKPDGGVQVEAQANARGSATSITVEYGQDAANLTNVVPVLTQLTGYRTRLVGTTLNNLPAGTTFHYRFRAVSGAGETLSAVQRLAALAEPVVTTNAVTEIAPTSARFNGTVNARNFDTAVVFEWGTDGNSFPNTVPAQPGTVMGNTDVPVSAAVAALPEGGTISYRLRATNAGGTAISGVSSFSTVSVTTSNPLPEQVGVTEATFRATINTFGQTAAVKFKYWADSAPGTIFETATQTVTSNGPTEVSARVTGLLENVAYSYRVSVELTGTETDGGAVPFTTDTNQAPVALPDLVFYSGQVLVDPLENDSDPNDGSNVNLLLAPALVVVPDVSRGVASVTNDRRGISYNPQFNVRDDDSLTYRVLDPLGASADGQVRLIAFSRRAGLYGGKIVFGSGATAREGQVAVQMGTGGAISTSFMAWPSEGAGERESFVLKGVFDQRGRFTRTLNSPSGAVLTLTLALDADAPRMLGTFEERVNEVSTTGEIAFMLTKNANTGGLAESGLRTGFLSPPSAQAGVMADGYLRMTVGKDARRGARFAGRLPDGEPFLAGARAEGRTYTLARALEQGGVFTGLVRAIDTSAGAGGMMGNLLWQKRASSRARYERGGVSSVLSLSGVAYPALERGALPPLGANVRLILGGVRRGDGMAVSYRDLLMQLVPGSMAAQFVGSDPMQTSGEDIPLTKLQVKVDGANAAFRGRFLHPATGRVVPFDGALRMPFDGEPVQGRGIFRGPGAAGSVRIEVE